MTFFDKFFASSKNRLFRCKNDDSIHCASTIKEQNDFASKHVRVVIFRECERRGRKLLFDSDAVEKLSADAASQTTDIVEVSPSHAYKYKKPSKDVASMGEMIFGSVALSTKVRKSSKIHIIPTPRAILFTAVVPSSTRCAPHPSRRFSGPKQQSSPNMTQGGCVSDSAMYRARGMHRTCGYASLSALSGPACCDSDAAPDSLRVPRGCEATLSRSVSMFRGGNDVSSRRPSDAPSVSSCSSFGDSKASNFSSNCSGGSLTSLRRRWNQSLAVSLDGSSCDEGEDITVRVRTKLGICLVLNISTYQDQTEIEKFLLSNSRAVDSILSRLQEDIEEAYRRQDAFVQLTVAARDDAAASVVQLIASRHLTRPKWMNPHRSGRSACCPSANSTGQDGLPRWLRPATCSANNTTEHNFVSAFCDVLLQFETKSTNFFVSTLLTALLTHNLSWAVDIAKRSSSEQVFPPKTAKIVITDSQAKPSLSTFVDVLSFFLRGSSLLEHDIEGDFVKITDSENQQNSLKSDNVVLENASDKVEVKNIAEDEGFGQERVADATKRWRAVAKLLVANKRMEINNPPMKIVPAKKIPTDVGDQVDEGLVSCVGEDNFDSGIDCELRDAIAFELSKARDVSICKQVLVTSASNKVAIFEGVDQFGTSIGKDVVAEMCLEQSSMKGKSGNSVRKTVSHFSFSDIIETPTVLDGCLVECGVDECDSVSRDRTNSVYEALELEEAERKITWTVGDNEPLSIIKDKDDRFGNTRANRDIKCMNSSVNNVLPLSQCKQYKSEEKGCQLTGVDDNALVPKSKSSFKKTEHSNLTSFVDQLSVKSSSKDCCNSIQSACSHQANKVVVKTDSRKAINGSFELQPCALVTEKKGCDLNNQFDSVEDKAISLFPPASNNTVPLICSANTQAISSPLDSSLLKKCSRRSWPTTISDQNNEDILKPLILNQPDLGISKMTENSGNKLTAELSGQRDLSHLPTDNVQRGKFNINYLGTSDTTSSTVIDSDNQSVTTENKTDALCFAPKNGCLYPDLTELARLENVHLDDAWRDDKTLFVDKVLGRTEVLTPSPDEGYSTLYGESAKVLLGRTEHMASHQPVYTNSVLIEREDEPPRRRRKRPTRSSTVNIPLVTGLKMLHYRTRTIDNLTSECFTEPPPPTLEEQLLKLFVELPMPEESRPTSSRIVHPCPFVGGVSDMMFPHHMLQGVSGDRQRVDLMVKRDLAAACKDSQSSHITETVCVLAEMESWCVWIHGSNRSSISSPRSVRASACPLVADMVESFAYLHRLGVPPRKCHEHLERKLEDMYRWSQCVADFLMDYNDICTAETLSTHLGINVNDLPLLLSITTVHTPEIADMYGVTIS